MKMLKIFIYIYFLFVLEHVVDSRSTGIEERNQLSEKSRYKNSYHDVDEDDETEQKLIQNNQKFDDDEFSNDSPNEVSEDSTDEDDDSLSDDSVSESEVLELNDELMKLSLDSFKALKEAVYEVDDRIEENQKNKRETHLESSKRKFQEEDEDDEFEEIDENIHKDRKRHDSCHCNKNCAAKNEDEGIIEKKIHAKINKLKDSSKMDKKRFLGYSKQSIRRNKRSASTNTSPSDSNQELNKEGLYKIREQYLESFPKDEGNMASINTFRKSDQFLQRVKRDN